VRSLLELKNLKAILIATNNPGKLKEIRELLPKKIKVYKPQDFNINEPKENGKTFKDNAKIKSLYCAKRSKIVSISDDSGLEVKYLDNQPGIYSARWAGKKKDFSIAIEKIKKKLLSKNKQSSPANFTCCISIAFPSGKSFEFLGKVFGKVCFPPRGQKGFGYDPIFISNGKTKTFAELKPSIKNKISHRYQAFKKIKKYFKFN
jgi:XTP/dITP diphosphohydrolase